MNEIAAVHPTETRIKRKKYKLMYWNRLIYRSIKCLSIDEGVAKMETAKLFTDGGSQAVSLPENCRFEGDEVYVNRIGNAVILLPKDDPWSTAVMGLSMFSEDFMDDCEDLPVQERAPL